MTTHRGRSAQLLVAPLASRRQRLKAQTGAAVYQAAMKLFAQRGLAATTVEDITRAAGVAKGTFFLHFRSKEEVFRPFLRRLLANVGGSLDEASATGGTREALRRLFCRNGLEFGRDAAIAGALFSSIFLNPTVRDMMATTIDEGRQGLVRIITLGQRRGEIRRDRKAEDIALAFQQAVLGTVFIAVVQGEGRLLARLEESFRGVWASVSAKGGMAS